jgi:triosephosphate isomerase
MNNLVVANWKMNPKSQKEAEKIFKEISVLAKELGKRSGDTSIVVCMPFPYLNIAKDKIAKFKNLYLGSQNVSEEIEGAFTGEVSAKMLKDSNVSYVIVGHSERRAMGETNSQINKKVLNILNTKLSPIICVGENERDNGGEYLSFVQKQIIECLNGVQKSQIKKVIIAYEPVWAIGANAKRVATPAEFLEMQIFIKKIISDIYDASIAHKILIIYGGSVHPENAESFVSENIASHVGCGFLVGRDSLSPKKFSAIINSIK